MMDPGGQRAGMAGGWYYACLCHSAAGGLAMAAERRLEGNRDGKTKMQKGAPVRDI
jgi:hypothetical protein